MAARTNIPELELSEEEGAQFTKAAQNVMRHYSVKATQKTLDTVAFFGVCAAIYAPRFAALKMRQVAEKRDQSNNGNVFEFTQGNIRG